MAAPSVAPGLTSFVGRSREVAEISALLREHRVVTLTGPGGGGKTRLAVAVAARGAECGIEDDAVWFVDVSATSDVDFLDAVGAGLGEDRSGLVLEDLTASIADQRGLLVVDNFEYLVSASPLVSRLVAGCRHLRVLVTSRTMLRVTGEAVYEVPPLECPPPERGFGVADLDRFDATRLFMERARESGLTVPVGAADAAAIAEICRLVEGLPLAIELAAVRLRVLPARELLARLGRPLGVLSGGFRDAPLRQQTLGATIEWSFGLLAPSAQDVLVALGALRSPFSLEAAEAVVGDEPLLDEVHMLLDHHLVRAGAGAGGVARYTLHPAVWEFARDRLTGHPDGDGFRRRHAQYFATRAVRAAPGVTGPDQVAELDRLDAEREDVTVAIAWLVQERRVAEALSVSASLKWFWFMRGHIHVARRVLASELALPGAPSHRREYAAALDAAAWFAQAAGDFAEGTKLAGEAVDLMRAVDDRAGTAWALTTLAYASARLASSPAEQASVVEMLRACRTLFTELGDDYGLSFALSLLGASSLWSGDIDSTDARALVSESLSLSRRIGDAQGTVRALLLLGWIVLDDGDPRRAARHFADALALSAALRHPYVMTYSLEAVAALAADRGDARRCVRLAAAAAALRERHAVAPAAPLQARLQVRIADAGRVLSDAERHVVEEAGRTLSVDDAVEEARRVAPASTSRPMAGVTLTARETAVLRLVADGLTDARVAGVLRVSVRTVNAHLRSIYTKLGVTSRAAATRLAGDAGLLEPVRESPR